MKILPVLKEYFQGNVEKVNCIINKFNYSPIFMSANEIGNKIKDGFEKQTKAAGKKIKRVIT